MKRVSLMIILFLILSLIPININAQENLAGDRLLGTGKYDDFEKPEVCGSCHVDF